VKNQLLDLCISVGLKVYGSNVQNGAKVTLRALKNQLAMALSQFPLFSLEGVAVGEYFLLSRWS
jgi:hypothetical protein